MHNVPLCCGCFDKSENSACLCATLSYHIFIGSDDYERYVYGFVHITFGKAWLTIAPK